MGTHPRQRVRTLIVSTPPNTAIAAAQSTTWTIGTGVLDKVDVVIPAGHVGLTGFQLLWGARQVVPYEGAEWITGDDDEITVDLDLWTGSGRVTVRTYNTDEQYPHRHHLRAYLTELEAADGLVLPGVPGVPVAGPGVELPELEAPEEEVPGELPEDEQLEEELMALADDILAALDANTAAVADLQATLADGFAGLLDALGAQQDELLGAVGSIPGTDLTKIEKRLARLITLEKQQKAKDKAKAQQTKAKAQARRPPRK